MATAFGARAQEKPIVKFIIPSFEWTKGSPYPIPYFVKYDLDDANNVSEDVFINGDPAFTSVSDTDKVKGDEAALKTGGVLSATRGKAATPLTYSPTVFINGNNAVRIEDYFYMNQKNTIGVLEWEEPPEKDKITDTGKSPEAEPAPEPLSFMDFF